jgi:hypothetical protein
MIAGILLLVAAAPASSADATGPSDGTLQTIAEQSFAEGEKLRADGVRARAAFGRSAVAYDVLWQRGYHNPELTLNRAHAHQLAGDLPRAIAALHEGLGEARWSRPLQVALIEARSSVGYPLVGDLAGHCRPSPPRTISSRMSPPEAWLIAAVLWLVVCGGVARYAMKRAGPWLFVSGLAAAALAFLGVLWLQDERQWQRENANPLLVLTDDVLLRTGNADGRGSPTEAYPPRLEPKLPRGVEVRQLWKRGGWVQVRLAGGVVGWVPESAVLRVRTTPAP